MTRSDWSIRFELAGDPSEDALDRLAEVLDAHGGIVGGGVAGATFGARLSVDADSAAAAQDIAVVLLERALDAAALPAASVVGLEVQSMDALIAANRETTVDALVGLSEIASEHGFSRQRAHELSRHPTFPAPIATIGRAPVWRLVDVERWMQIPRKPGRPVSSRATTPGVLSAPPVPRRKRRVAAKQAGHPSSGKKATPTRRRTAEG